MKKLNIVAIPYRDRYFLESYGNAVRDLHIIQALSRSSDVASVSVINRPVTMHERLLGIKRIHAGNQDHPDFEKTRWITLADHQLLGPLGKRRWLEHCYGRHIATIAGLKKDGHVNILLDFSPISKIDYAALGFDIVWYDAIDNFSKHNRFSERERELVNEKYALVSASADMVTAVSEGATTPMRSAANVEVLPNGLPADSGECNCYSAIDAQDFGFMGFVTDKFDVNLVRKLASKGYTIAIHGDVYDKRIGNELAKIVGVTLFGAFKHKDLDRVCNSFKVGLIPYLKNKLHDESPLKLYQYLRRGKPVLSSVTYEVNNDFVCVYDHYSDDELYSCCSNLVAQSISPETQKSIARSISRESYWDHKIAAFLSSLGKLYKPA